MDDESVPAPGGQELDEDSVAPPAKRSRLFPGSEPLSPAPAPTYSAPNVVPQNKILSTRAILSVLKGAQELVATDSAADRDQQLQRSKRLAFVVPRPELLERQICR